LIAADSPSASPASIPRANLALVAFSRFNNTLDGQVFVFFIITVAAAEVSVGLALIVALYRKRQTAHVEDLTIMKL